MIIVLAHTGMGDEQVIEMEENATYDLTKVEGIDAIITGHSHPHFPGSFKSTRCEPKKGTINGVPVVMPGSWGNQLGVIDLTIAKEKGKWKVKQSQASLRAIYDKNLKLV